MAVQKEDAVNTVATEPVASSVAQTPKVGLFDRIKRYLREVMAELKKTNWPSRDELTKSTVIVVLTIVVVALFLSACDWASARIMSSSFVGIVPPGTGR